MDRKRFVLVYQAGIANIFQVEQFTMTAEGRNAVRLLQSAFEPCFWFAAGAGSAGAIVRTAYCNQAGDITDSEWNQDRESAHFSEKAVPVKAN